MKLLWNIGKAMKDHRSKNDDDDNYSFTIPNLSLLWSYTNFQILFYCHCVTSEC